MGARSASTTGSISPFECDATAAIRFGQRNDLTVFVHNASGKYVRPGVEISEEMVANAYRPAANEQSERNWVGIVGDVTLSWRPIQGIDDVFVDTSVRKKNLTAFIRVPSCESGAVLRAVVLDDGKPVLELPSAEVGAGANASLSSGWNDPILWGSAPYGEPKLYTLRTELVSADGRTLDRVFTRFGFREVWVSGQDVLLNGKKLWLAGTYFSKHSAIRDVNDRRPIRAMIDVMRGAGLNTLHGHWVDLGRSWLVVCDETGMCVVAGFFCDGRPQIQSRADAGWAEWMNVTCAEWVRARRNHPSILVWRPTDVPPPQLDRFISLDDFHAGIAAAVRENDPAKRPIADGSDLAAWGQPPEDRATGEFNNFGLLQTNHDSGKPFLCKEIYGGFNQPDKYRAFVEEYYRRSFDLGSTGMLVQQLPLLPNPSPGTFAISWLSLSGIGNRNTAFAGSRGELPNWCDSHFFQRRSPFADLFEGLFQKYMHAKLEPAPVSSPDVLVDGGSSPKSFVFLAPENVGAAEPRGLWTAPDRHRVASGSRAHGRLAIHRERQIGEPPRWHRHKPHELSSRLSRLWQCAKGLAPAVRARSAFASAASAFSR